MVGMPGIEPGLYEPESYVLPVYYIPKLCASSIFQTISHVKENSKTLLEYGILPGMLFVYLIDESILLIVSVF